MILFCDTSALIKLLIDEPGSDQMHAISSDAAFVAGCRITWAEAMKDGVNILKGYMASGEFSRGKESIRAEGGIMMVDNFDVDVEQQKRCLKSEFRNTHFSYAIGIDGIEKFVSTPELHSDEAIDGDPLPPGQVWAISPGSGEVGPSLYREPRA